MKLITRQDNGGGFPFISQLSELGIGLNLLPFLPDCIRGIGTQAGFVCCVMKGAAEGPYEGRMR